MSDIPERFTDEYYNDEYFAGLEGGKSFRRGDNQTAKWSYYNPDGEAPACQPIAEAFQTIFHPETMLDVGAGRGTLISYAVDAGIQAVGFDWSRWSVGAGRYKRCRPEWLIRHDGTKPLPYETGRFDLVTALDYMEHMYTDDLPQVIRELYRVTNNYLFLEIDTVDGHREKGYILEKNKPVPLRLEANAVAGHVTVQPEQYWIDKFEQEDLILRRDLKHWFISLVPKHAIQNWLLNSILIFEKE